MVLNTLTLQTYCKQLATIIPSKQLSKTLEIKIVDVQLVKKEAIKDSKIELRDDTF